MFQLQVILKIQKLQLVVADQTVNLCKMKESKNIFMQFFTPILLKKINPPFTKCPIRAGLYAWESPSEKEIQDGLPLEKVPTFMKTLKSTMASNLMIFSSIVDGEKIEIMKIYEIHRFTYKA